MGLFDQLKAQAYARGLADAGMVDYVAEPLLTLGSGAIAEPVAGLGGLMHGGDVGLVNALREGMTYQPRTQQGQAGLNALANALRSAKTTFVDENPPVNALAQFLTQATDAAGEFSPGLGASMKAVPLAALALMGPGSSVARQAFANVGRGTAQGANALAQLAYQNAGKVPSVRGPLYSQRGIIDVTGLPNKGVEIIQGSADDFAQKLRDLGFDANVEHSGSTAGPSSYVRVTDPQTGRYFTDPVRFSGHAKGAFNSQFVRDVTDIPSDTQRYLAEALQMRAKGPSAGMLAQIEVEAKLTAQRAARLERIKAKVEAAQPLSNSELRDWQRARMSDSN
jgi:hypothetical protein